MKFGLHHSIALLAPLALAACTPPPAPVERFAPLDYSYLHPIALRAATVDIVDNHNSGPDEAALVQNNPAPPAPTLLAMLKHRLQPSGEPGAATVTVQAASITENNGTLNGQMTVDISLVSGDGRATGSAEASVSTTEAAPDNNADPNELQAALYQMTKNMMDSMNVQLPYQIAHHLQDWVVWSGQPGAVNTANPAGTSIQATPLAPPAQSSPPAAGNAVPNYLPGAGPAALGAPP